MASTFPSCVSLEIDTDDRKSNVLQLYFYRADEQFKPDIVLYTCIKRLEEDEMNYIVLLEILQRLGHSLVLYLL